MNSPDGVERISKEMARSMIARIARTAAGYTLRPDGNTYGKMERMNGTRYTEYYEIAKEYAAKVIDSQKHKLAKPFYQVFLDECNFLPASGDDVIREIPFAKTANGKVGYSHGVKLDSYQSETPHPYGEAKSDVRLNGVYRYMFNENDVRRDYVNQLTKYDAPAGEAMFDNNYTVSNGKWSKLWVTGGLGNGPPKTPVSTSPSCVIPMFSLCMQKQSTRPSTVSAARTEPRLWTPSPGT